MRKSTQNLSFLLGVLLLAFTSCSDDDLGGGTGVDPDPVDSELVGSIDNDMTLDASIDYNLTGVLSVEPGATLTIPAGTTINTAIGTDVYIVVQQGAMIDIQGTASSPVRMAPSTAGTWGGLLLLGEAETTAGSDATAEVGGLIYGGTNNNDSSGSIEYLIIENSGAQINADSQYNGLTLYAVGSGTTIENVAILNGEDDGIEFFGGAVNATNIYVEDLQDDAIDWTEGWSGTLTNTYVLHTRGDFSTALEADGNETQPNITNFTAVSETGGTALQFKSVSGANITGLSLSGYDTSVELADPEEGDFANIQIEGQDSNPNNTYSNPNQIDLSIFSWINDALSEPQSLSGSIDEDMTLDAETTYYLDGVFSVESGATLTIPAGTTINTATGTDVYIVIQKGAMIDIQGTAEAPVRMAPSEPGTWGGLLLLGDAETTAGSDATAEVGGLIYGGTNNEDNSGSIQYLIIENSGAQINADSQYNGLTLYAVGSGTTIENVALLNGEDDGIEFFGGAVSVTNVYVQDLQDDAIDWTEGWSGTLTNTYVLHTRSDFSTALEADGNATQPSIVNFTAISENGGTALQFKSVSGAIITGLSLTGYDTSIELADPEEGDFANIEIDGVVSDPTNTYEAEATVNVEDFSWVN
ncbi:hypothetical protein SAMN04487907_101180 [Zunongwangia mangrovi]|uniref:Uncharacterized protein n=1 Tax=Zunongwangia mangrovi TaxID=1334022 RepID=A0A1I1D721_9FLAO|nr:hypothetical protein [Zunongwangia mangrovi]SFB70715.1 hypothetical protein SAMN04487907_101180 [Zunongwangia mangrovi]